MLEPEPISLNSNSVNVQKGYQDYHQALFNQKNAPLSIKPRTLLSYRTDSHSVQKQHKQTRAFVCSLIYLGEQKWHQDKSDHIPFERQVTS